ncbi:MAG: protein kinase, partial [Planctomycetota bacterium]
MKPAHIIVGSHGEALLDGWDLAGTNADENSGGGTPAYFAPETARSTAIADATATDVYLLGATLYHLFAGQAPHHASTVHEALRSAACSDPPPISAERNIPRRLLAIQQRAMADAPHQRPSAAELGQELRLWLHSRTSETRAAEIANRGANSLLTALDSDEVSTAYRHFGAALSQYRAARALAPDFPTAVDGARRTATAFVHCALSAGDLHLATMIAKRHDDPALIDQVATAASKQRWRHYRRIAVRA